MKYLIMGNINIQNVDEGPIVGPLLFLINNNIIVYSCNILSFVLVVDDTAVYVHYNSSDGAIQILN